MPAYKLILLIPNFTTNDLTRANQPETRYWRAPVEFKSGDYTSTTIRFNNIRIPYVNGRLYGQSYVYMALPDIIRKKTIQAADKKYKVVPDDKGIMRVPGIWWMAVNGIEDIFGVVDPATKGLLTKNVTDIFINYEAGLEATVELRIMCKASTAKKQDLSAATPRTITVELVHAYITKIKRVIDPPARASDRSQPANSKPVVTSAELPDDALIKDLEELGIN